MKKLLYLFSATLLVLSSCSSDDDTTSAPTTTVLLKKSSYVSTGESFTTDFTYSGNKLVSSVDSFGDKTTFTYTGELITKIVDTDNKGVVDQTTEFTYTNGKLTSEISLETGDDYKYKTKYVHNTDGTISFEDFRVAVATGKEEEYGYIGKYTFKNGNLVKKEKSYYGTNSSETYEYDAKNNPFKNVVGFNLLVNDEEGAYVNNIVKRTYSNSTDIYTNTYEYKYNAESFPTEQKGFYNGASDGISTFTY
ncbi:hypothetical protein MCETHM1_00618 [Flavobacteriaceae bacterium]